MLARHERPQRRYEALSKKPRAKFWVDFWRKVDEAGGCWLWRGGVDQQGRGVVRFGQVTARAALVAWAYDGRSSVARLSSRCGRPGCIRPAHQVAQ